MREWVVINGEKGREGEVAWGEDKGKGRLHMEKIREREDKKGR